MSSDSVRHWSDEIRALSKEARRSLQRIVVVALGGVRLMRYHPGDGVQPKRSKNS